MGKRPFQAVIDAADAIGFVVVATIFAVFLSVRFIGGTIGQYFSHFGLPVLAAVLVAYLFHPK